MQKLDPDGAHLPVERRKSVDKLSRSLGPESLAASTVSATVGEAARRSSENLQSVLADFKDDESCLLKVAGGDLHCGGVVDQKCAMRGSAIKALERTGTAFDQKAISKASTEDKPASTSCSCVLQ